MKTIKIIFIFTEIIIQKMCKSMLSGNLSITMVGRCRYANVCLHNKDLILSRLDSLFSFPNQL